MNLSLETLSITVPHRRSLPSRRPRVSNSSSSSSSSSSSISSSSSEVSCSNRLPISLSSSSPTTRMSSVFSLDHRSNFVSAHQDVSFRDLDDSCESLMSIHSDIGIEPEFHAPMTPSVQCGDWDSLLGSRSLSMSSKSSTLLDRTRIIEIYDSDEEDSDSSIESGSPTYEKFLIVTNENELYSSPPSSDGRVLIHIRNANIVDPSRSCLRSSPLSRRSRSSTNLTVHFTDDVVVRTISDPLTSLQKDDRLDALAVGESLIPYSDSFSDQTSKSSDFDDTSRLERISCSDESLIENTPYAISSQSPTKEVVHLGFHSPATSISNI